MIPNTSYIRFTNVAIRLINMLTKFVLVIFIARYLSIEDVAQYGLITAFQIFSIYFLGLDFYIYTTREIVGETSSKINFVLKNHILLFLIIFSLYSIFYSVFFTQLSIHKDLFFLVLLIVLLEYIGTEIYRLFLALQKQLLATLSIFIRSSLWIILFIICAYLSEDLRNLYSITYFWLAFLLLNLLISIFLLIHMGYLTSKEQINFTWISRGLKISIPFLLGTLALKSISTLDRYYLENNAPHDLAAYTLFLILTSFIQACLEAGFFAFSLPKLIQHKKNNDYKSFKTLSKQLSKHTFIFIIICAISSPVFIYFSLLIINEAYYQSYSGLFYCIYFINLLFAINLLINTLNYALNLDRSIIRANILSFVIFLVVIVFLPYLSAIETLLAALIISTLFSIFLKLRLFLRAISNLQ